LSGVGFLKLVRAILELENWVSPACDFGTLFGKLYFSLSLREETIAGGTNAAIVPCVRCVGPAVRTCEGLEDDHYRCSKCGYEFSIDWDYDGPPQAPCWPISEEETKKRRKMAAQYLERLGRK
jgi:hypothetical protein